MLGYGFVGALILAMPSKYVHKLEKSVINMIWILIPDFWLANHNN
jgi:hypothetical protein